MAKKNWNKKDVLSVVKSIPDGVRVSSDTVRELLANAFPDRPTCPNTTIRRNLVEAAYGRWALLKKVDSRWFIKVTPTPGKKHVTPTAPALAPKKQPDLFAAPKAELVEHSDGSVDVRFPLRTYHFSKDEARLMLNTLRGMEE